MSSVIGLRFDATQLMLRFASTVCMLKSLYKLRINGWSQFETIHFTPRSVRRLTYNANSVCSFCPNGNWVYDVKFDVSDNGKYGGSKYTNELWFRVSDERWLYPAERSIVGLSDNLSLQFRNNS